MGMNKVFDKSFKVGIMFGVLLYVVIYIYNIPPSPKSICFDCYEVSGFPFISYESGTILHLNNVLWLGQIANVFVAVNFIIAIGLIFKLFRSGISARSLK